MVEKTIPPAKKSVAKKNAAKKPAAKKVTSSSKSAKLTQSESDQLVSFYEEMMMVRRFEERAARSYTQALIGDFFPNRLSLFSLFTDRHDRKLLPWNL